MGASGSVSTSSTRSSASMAPSTFRLYKSSEVVSWVSRGPISTFSLRTSKANVWFEFQTMKCLTTVCYSWPTTRIRVNFTSMRKNATVSCTRSPSTRKKAQSTSFTFWNMASFSSSWAATTQMYCRAVIISLASHMIATSRCSGWANRSYRSKSPKQAMKRLHLARIR